MIRVRSSKYRHVYGDPTRKDKCFDNIRLTKNAFDANLAKSNGKYISLNWEASGGGSFGVFPVEEVGKLPDRFPLFDGHKGPVLDTDWNPFDDTMVVSASEDGTIGIWKVPENFSVHEEYGALDNCKDISPVKFLEGHGKKVGHVKFNPVAKNVLASASLDNSIKIWDIETGKILFTLQHPSFVTSFDWNYDGTQIASVAKDKQLRIWDVREEKILTSGKGHAGAKGSRIVWLGDRNRVLTTGFSLVSDREMAIWDSADVAKGPIGGFRGLDPSSGIVIPHYDPMTSMVYLGGRGDGKIVYFEYADDTLYDLFAYNSTSPQRGLGWVPNVSLDPHNHEVARAYKVHENMVEPIPFKVPLKNEGFLDNVYTFVEVGKPALTASEWTSGKTARPYVRYWKDIYHGKDTEPFEAPKLDESAAAPSSTGSASSKSEKTESKDVKTESKPEPKKAEAPKSEVKKAEPVKAEPKAEGKEEPTSKASAKEISAESKAEKQDSYDVLQSKEVKSFLAKNTQEADASEEEDEDSAWGSEPADEPKKEEPKKEEPKKEEPKKAESIKKEEPVKKEEPKKVEPVKKEEPQKAGPVKKAEPEPKTAPKIADASSVDDKLEAILEQVKNLHKRIDQLEANSKK